jgi:hypothetical protein
MDSGRCSKSNTKRMNEQGAKERKGPEERKECKVLRMKADGGGRTRNGRVVRRYLYEMGDDGWRAARASTAGGMLSADPATPTPSREWWHGDERRDGLPCEVHPASWICPLVDVVPCNLGESAVGKLILTLERSDWCRLSFFQLAFGLRILHHHHSFADGTMMIDGRQSVVSAKPFGRFIGMSRSKVILKFNHPPRSTEFRNGRKMDE